MGLSSKPGCEREMDEDRLYLWYGYAWIGAQTLSVGSGLNSSISLNRVVTPFIIIKLIYKIKIRNSTHCNYY